MGQPGWAVVGLWLCLACARATSAPPGDNAASSPHQPQDRVEISTKPLNPVLRDGPNEWLNRDVDDQAPMFETSDPRITGSFYDALAKFRSHPQIRTASWGLCVLDRKTGHIKVNVNCDLSLTPASILKVVTTGSALLGLGDDFRFTTRLLATGVLSPSGVLHGDLIIMGGGDPTLGSERVVGSLSAQEVMRRWTEAVAAHGILAVQGDVIIETRIFDAELVPSTWNWDDVGYHYGAPIDGLNFKDNYAHLVFKSKPDTLAVPDLVSVVPSDWDVNIISRLTIDDQGRGLYAFGGPLMDQRFISGSLPASQDHFTVNVSMPDPAQYAADRFIATLRGIGIPVRGQARTLRYHTDTPPRFEDTARVLDWYDSPPLSEIVKVTNLTSMNMYTEALVKMLGVHYEGQGTLNAGLNAIREIWRDRDVSWQGVSMSDGSGLSRANMITPRHMVAITDHLLKSQARQTMWDSLPVAARSGSLRRAFLKTPAENNLRAKSGYLTRARSYTGYVESGVGDLIFSLSVNDYNGLDFRVKSEIHTLLASLAAWGRSIEEPQAS